MRKWMRLLSVLLVFTIVSAISTKEVRATEAATADGAAKPEEEKTEEEKAKEAEEAKQKELDALYNIPVQTNDIKEWPDGPGTYGESAIVMDAESGAILYAKNIDQKEYPASITKVLTALVAYKYADMTGNVTITPHSMECLGSGYASIGMKEGNVLTMDQAMHAMLMASSNEVACAVGEATAVSQGKEYNWFIEQMNETVQELGGKNSNFVNTNGVHDESHYTCARDMALIGRALFAYPDFFSICQTLEYTIPGCDTTEEHIFQQKHKMLIPTDQEYYQNAIGGKTGYTTEANNTLITMADNGERKLICVVLKTYAGHNYSDTQALLDYGFQHFKKISIQENEKTEEIKSIPEDAYVLVPDDVKFKNLDKEMEWKDKTEGVAVLTYYYKDMPVGSTEVTMDSKHIAFSDSSQKVQGKGDGQADNDGAAGILKKVLLAAGLGIVVLIIILLLVLWNAKRRRRRRRRRRR